MTEEQGSKRKVLTLLMLFFPTVLVAAIPTSIDGGYALPLALKILIAFYQFIIIKNFVDTHYGE